MDADILGTLERRVMEQLWRVSSATVAEVRDALNAVGPRALAYTTVMTILVRLHEKGYVTRQAEGRRFRYRAALDEENLEATIARRELSRLIERHGAASLAGFAADLVGADSQLTQRLRDLSELRSDDR
ncbi:MAG TPA: BlaI/MecI/CopY family transcriptional regulator [Gemmatimonadaceae bacterium]